MFEREKRQGSLAILFFHPESGLEGGVDFHVEHSVWRKTIATTNVEDEILVHGCCWGVYCYF